MDFEKHHLYNSICILIGDSGGGLYAYDMNLNKYILSGIVSYGGVSCGIYGKPG